LSEKTTIPLFPLNVILFPDSKIPLFIFEERYKTMINECIENKSVFGVNLIENKKIHTTGCSARITEITQRYENGETRIIVTGEKIYELMQYKPNNIGYYAGEIIYKPEETNLADEKKIKKAVKYYNELVSEVYKGGVKLINLEDSDWKEKKYIAFYIAQKAGLSLLEKQNLLEINDENARLDYVIKYFEDVIPQLKEATRVSNIIKSDGYIQ
jgi:Lon protease-like protein